MMTKHILLEPVFFIPPDGFTIIGKDDKVADPGAEIFFKECLRETLEK